MNVKELARKREKVRKRLGRDQMVFFTERSFSFHLWFLPNSLVVSDNVASCTRVSHHLYLTVEVAYCDVSYVVSGRIPSCHILLGLLSLCDTLLVSRSHITAHHYLPCFLCFC